MTIELSPRRLWSSLAAALTLVSAAASAQQPPAEPPPSPPPAAAPPSPPPPAAAAPVAQEGAETYPRMKDGAIMLGTETWLRVGLQAQVWADYLQSLTTDGNYATNLFLRRGRIIIGAQVTKDVNLWFQLDAPRLGFATAVTTCANAGTPPAPVCTTSVGKRFLPQDGGGEILQDAWGELKIAGDAFMLEAGLMVIPFSHNELQSTTTFITLDVGTVSAGIVPNTSGTRDAGLQLKGYVADDKLEYRLGVFSGARQNPNGTNPIGHTAPRITGKLQYQFLDVEKGYVYSGHSYGKKKLLGVSAGFDFQKADDLQGSGGATTSVDPYYGISAGVFGAYPLSGEAAKTGGDELAFLAELYRYDGGTNGAAATANIVPQNDLLVEAGYYNNDLKLSVFGKLEMKKAADDKNNAQDQQWFGGGLKYYVLPGNNMNFTLAYQRINFPNAASGAPSGQNELTLQTQFFYY